MDGPSERPSEESENAAEPLESYEPQTPVQRANTVEDLSVSPGPPVVRPSPGNRGMYSVFDNGFTGAADPAASTDRSESAIEVKAPAASRTASSGVPARPIQKLEPVTVWYDVTQARERDQLKTIVLSEGDVVTVRTAAQPLRISGIVNRTGAYPLPSGRTVNVWQAIELAGGVRDENVPLNITLLRPAAEGRGARRWFLNVASYDQHPATSPLVEPGDELHVEPTTGSKIKRVVRNVWSKLHDQALVRGPVGGLVVHFCFAVRRLAMADVVECPIRSMRTAAAGRPGPARRRGRRNQRRRNQRRRTESGRRIPRAAA